MTTTPYLLIEDGGKLAPMPTDLVDRLAMLVAVCRFPGMGAHDSWSLRLDSYDRMQKIFCSSIYFCSLSNFFRGCAVRSEISCNVFLLLFMTIWVLVFRTLCRREIRMLWYAVLFLGLGPVGFSPSCSFFALWFPLPLFLVNSYIIRKENSQHSQLLTMYCVIKLLLSYRTLSRE
jgi:hypothetical protein